MNPDFKIRGLCKGCKRNKWFIRKRKVKIPTGAVATSQDLMCTKCYNRLLGNLDLKRP